MKNKTFKVCPLASGSKGNSLYVGCGRQGILVDAGLSGKEIQKRLAMREIPEEMLSAVILTHEHSDHVKGAGVLSRRFNIPVYVTEKTYLACSGLGKMKDLIFMDCGRSFFLDDICITPFPISHDATDPVGLTMECGNQKIGIATDLGVVTNLVKDHLKNSNLLYLESNHDLELLMNGPYPWHLKQRIKSRVGHLSNADTRQLVSELKSDQLKHVILAHLSEENNCPQKAAVEVSQSLNASGIKLHVAGPSHPLEIIYI